MSHPDPYKALGEVRDLTGSVVYLRPLEQVETVKIEDGLVSISIATCSYVETSTSYRIKKRGYRVIQFKLKGYWHRTEQTFWLDEHCHDIVHKYDSVLTALEAKAKRAWERECARPGTARLPMDSAEAAEGERMLKHWGIS